MSYKNCVVDSKENYKFDLKVKGLKQKITNIKQITKTKLEVFPIPLHQFLC